MQFPLTRGGSNKYLMGDGDTESRTGPLVPLRPIRRESEGPSARHSSEPTVPLPGSIPETGGKNMESEQSEETLIGRDPSPNDSSFNEDQEEGGLRQRERKPSKRAVRWKSNPHLLQNVDTKVSRSPSDIKGNTSDAGVGSGALGSMRSKSREQDRDFSPSHDRSETMDSDASTDTKTSMVKRISSTATRLFGKDPSPSKIGHSSGQRKSLTRHRSFARLLKNSRGMTFSGSTLDLLEGQYRTSSLLSVKGVLSPNSSFKRSWNLLLFLVVMYNSLLVPFYCSFQIVFTVYPPSVQFILNYICDILWVIDIGLAFFTGFFEEGFLVTDKQRIRRKYLKSYFAVDVISAIPLDIAAISIGSIWLPFLRLNKMLQFYRVHKYELEFERILRVNANFSSLFRLLMLFVFFVHWLGCLWYLIGYLQKQNGAPIVWQDKLDLFAEGNFDKFTTSLYFCLTAMTTVGFGDISPTTNIERQYVMVVELIGVSVYATAFGNLTTLVQNMNFTSIQFRRQVDTITEYMKFRRLPNSLKKRVLNYYDVLWSRHRGLDENDILKELPGSLRAEVSLALNRELVTKVPLFRDCIDPGFINSLVVMLLPVTALPGDYVVRYGEIGQEMYFVRRGQVSIMSKDGQTCFATLKDGMFFGEVALMQDVRRTASVRASTYCDLLMLTKEDFERVVAYFPGYGDRIKRTAEALGQQYKGKKKEEEANADE